MKQNLFFVNFPRTEAIENFATQRLLRVLSKFTRARVEASDVWFQMENSPEHPGKDKFCCEVRVHSGLLDRPLFIKKSGDNLYEAIVAVSNVLSQQLGRLHERILARRDHRADRRRRRGVAKSLNAIEGLIPLRVRG